MAEFKHFNLKLYFTRQNIKNNLFTKTENAETHKGKMRKWQNLTVFLT